MGLTTRSTSHPHGGQRYFNVRMHQDSTCSSTECVVVLQHLARSYALAFLCAVEAPIIGCPTFSALSASCCERSLAFPRSFQNATNVRACDKQQCSPHVGFRPGVFLSSLAFSQALGESLPQILAAFQSHSSPSLPSLVSHATASASPLAGDSASVTASTTSSATYLPFPSATGNISVPSFISTYCTLGNSSLPATLITGKPSLSGARSAPNRSLSAAGQSFTPAFAIGSSFPSSLVQSLNRPFIVGPGYSPIPEKLVSKIRTGHFIDPADLLAGNLKAQETKPQTYLDRKLLVSSTKKRVQEITDIVTWVEAFTVYSWILCSAHPSRWQDITQHKLLILKTTRQLSGKAWLHYDIAFQKDAAASGLVSCELRPLQLSYSCITTLIKPVVGSNLQLHHWWPVHPIFVDPGMTVPVAGLSVNAIFATPVRGVKDSTPVSIVPFSLHSPVSGAHGQLPLLGVNASGVSSSKTACQRNFVNIVNTPCPVLPSNVVFPMSVNAVPVTQDVARLRRCQFSFLVPIFLPSLAPYSKS